MSCYEYKKLVQRYRFLRYVAVNWAFHANICENERIEKLCKDFIGNENKIQSAIELASNIVQTDNLSRKISSIHAMAFWGQKSIFSKTLAGGADPNTKDAAAGTPLWSAVLGGQKEIVELLLSRNDVKLNWTGHYRYIQTPLTLGIEWDEIEIVRSLVACQSVNVNVGIPDIPLKFAMRRDNVEIFECLLARERLLAHKHVRVNAKDHQGQTPLMYAVIHWHPGIVDLVLEVPSVDVNAKDIEGNTALILCASGFKWKTCNVELQLCLSRLLEHPEIDLNATDNEGLTALIVLVTSQYGKDAVSLLLSYFKLDLDAIDGLGRDVIAQVEYFGKINADRWGIGSDNRRAIQIKANMSASLILIKEEIERRRVSASLLVEHASV